MFKEYFILIVVNYFIIFLVIYFTIITYLTPLIYLLKFCYGQHGIFSMFILFFLSYFILLKVGIKVLMILVKQELVLEHVEDIIDSFLFKIIFSLQLLFNVLQSYLIDCFYIIIFLFNIN
mmetsp:Transcript_15623/g.1402  ORF Transcript_15623/g.1402 Transcript_15623/m.1402 type:complete len:120 (-) Transcript_15623:70-429(-)